MMRQDFLPKDSTAGDELPVTRTAATVRPLGIENREMRFSAAGWNYVLQDVVGEFISPNQRGFRQAALIVQSIIDSEAGG